MSIIESIAESFADAAQVAELDSIEARGRAAGYLDDEGYFTQSDEDFFADLG